MAQGPTGHSVALFRYCVGTCQCSDRKCLAVVMSMHKADSEGTFSTAVHLILHVRGRRCHPGSVSFTWTLHSKSDPVRVKMAVLQESESDFEML
jgi:hypothetical protein